MMNMGTLIHEGNANNHSIIFCKGRRGRRTVKLSQTKSKNAEDNPIIHNNATSGATHPYSISKEAVRIDSSQVLVVCCRNLSLDIGSGPPPR